VVDHNPNTRVSDVTASNQCFNPLTRIAPYKYSHLLTYLLTYLLTNEFVLITMYGITFNLRGVKIIIRSKVK